MHVSCNFAKFAINSGIFLVESLEFFTHKTVPFVNRDNLLLPFQFICLSFSCLTVLDRISNTILNRSGEPKHTVLFWILEEKFLIPSMTYPYMDSSYMTFIMLRKFPSIPPLLSGFNMERCLTWKGNFLKFFFYMLG